ncbi:MAG: deoxynucleoside kinase [Prolixibacteraceae bacterium]|nr:deoxynucleoside kinase [Prolixibacteraceae bacterium]
MQFLVIEGNIGSGKTTLAKMLAGEINAKLILEQFEENPFLKNFYNDPSRFSFQLEISLLIERYNQIKKELIDIDPSDEVIIADYYFAKTKIFAGNTLSPDEYRIFCEAYNILSGELPKPDLYIYLNAPEEKLLNNIKKRGRDYEQEISGDYLKKINREYQNFFNKVNDFPIFDIDISKIDFVADPRHYDQLKKIIRNADYKNGLNKFFM